jgi:hypothetical protein
MSKFEFNASDRAPDDNWLVHQFVPLGHFQSRHTSIQVVSGATQ